MDQLLGEKLRLCEQVEALRAEQNQLKEQVASTDGQNLDVCVCVCTVFEYLWSPTLLHVSLSWP